MKVSDYVADFLARQGVRHVFGIAGGASLHLIHSVADHPELTLVCPHHEQAAAMAADGYARATGNIGVAIATSGPGATNLITGICCAYYDSVPLLLVTGQVSTFRLKGNTGVRQIGFQETDVVEMCRSITKYAVLVTDVSRIRYELEKAAFLARNGRPGPVLVDIPDNLQREHIEPTALGGFEPPAEVSMSAPSSRQVDAITALIRIARRPVLVVGWGVRLSGAEKSFLAVADKLQIPVLPTWAMKDLLPSGHPLLVGTFGTHGTRHGNFAVQNADLVLAIGSRLDTHETGSPPSTFARAADKVVVDIDEAELAKFGAAWGDRFRGFHGDAGRFLDALDARLGAPLTSDLTEWWRQIGEWKRAFGASSNAPRYADERVDPYLFMDQLADSAAPGDMLFVDTGCALAWMMQAFECKPGQRIFHAFNNTAMGYALPASVGGWFAVPDRRIVCVVGDGSLQMNVQELATVAFHRVPLKIFVMNNHGYSMIQQTQDQWLGSRYIASSAEGGLGMPDFPRVAEAYGIPSLRIERPSDAVAQIRAAMTTPGPVLCDVDIPAERRVMPQVKYGRPIEDSEPLLSRDLFLASMIVDPLDVSRA